MNNENKKEIEEQEEEREPFMTHGQWCFLAWCFLASTFATAWFAGDQIKQKESAYTQLKESWNNYADMKVQAANNEANYNALRELVMFGAKPGNQISSRTYKVGNGTNWKWVVELKAISNGKDIYVSTSESPSKPKHSGWGDDQ